MAHRSKCSIVRYFIFKKLDCTIVVNEVKNVFPYKSIAGGSSSNLLPLQLLLIVVM